MLTLVKLSSGPRRKRRRCVAQKVVEQISAIVACRPGAVVQYTRVYRTTLIWLNPIYKISRSPGVVS